ncbi:DnaJ family domain-containing protein [Aquibacillus albus]|uniref:DnaJ homologue subfamily C member 28 conserved domain-containing protein n=1 Tax=Aquibacillus albus TaxID=1168171 RepID=A0ABS2N2R1_9BACI|nr:DnaJ family domain-containing protein [Aquibacillus albus]MBM7572412.1 hypothetical protein [Aquibacillus albus]
MDFVSLMAEEKIKKAIEEGDLDNLPGKGKPLKLEDISAIPEDLRTSYHMMKNSGYLPEEVKVNKELVSLRELINACKDDTEKAELEKKLTEKELQFKLLMEKTKRNQTSAYRKYSGKINKLFGENYGASFHK